MWRGLYLLLAVLTVVYAQQTSFKTCQQSEICSYLRNKPAIPGEFRLVTNYIFPANNTLRLHISRNDTNVLNLLISFYQEDVIRLQIYEVNDPNRYYLDTVLDGEPAVDPSYNFIFQNSQSATLVWGGSHYLYVNSNPFYVEIYNNQDLIAVFNQQGRLTFEHDGSSRAVGFDINFPNATYAYGLPLHADNIFLRQTTNGGDPYRLYNLNNENYDTESTQALSGSVPVLYAHGIGITAGVFFHNGYETWVDLDYSPSGVDTYYMVEDGIFDAFVLLGPTPADVNRQYLTLTGVTPLPPLWALGYHHTATTYDNQDAITDIVDSFASGDFPLESIWIQNHDRSFEWDSSLYSDPGALQGYLTQHFKKLGVMIKPSLSVVVDYPLLNQAVNQELLVFAPTRFPFIGRCDAGNCTWWDFINPNTFLFYLDLFANYPIATAALQGFWNEANEPLVLDAEERALGRENIHFSGFSHKDIHNIYSHNMNLATYYGSLQLNSQRRPFVISESFFAGSQRYAAVYTGKTAATWDQLRTSFRMCLAASFTGIHFCGGNIGGFFGDVDEQLIARWYQLGAWLPLFRSHYSDEASRREPYLFSTAAQANIRAALKNRYTHIPIWYTLFYEHERYKTAVLQPLFYRYPSNTELEQQDSFFVGDSILVHPITQPGLTITTPYLVPGEIWYDVDNNLVYSGYGPTLVNVYPDRIPTFYRGGSIIARKDDPAGNTVENSLRQYTVYIFLDSGAEAHGRLYIDDGESFSYRNRNYYYITLNYVNATITFSEIDSDATYPGGSFVVDRYLLYRPSSVIRSGSTKEAEYIEPEVYTHSTEGTKFETTPVDLSERVTIQLL